MELFPTTTELDLPIKQKLLAVLKAYGWCLLLILVAAPIVMMTNYWIKQLFQVDITHTNQITTLTKSPLDKYLYVPILAPLMEETLFRLWQDYKIRSLVISCGLLALFMFASYMRHHHLICIFLAAGAVIAIFLLCLKRKPWNSLLTVPFAYRKILFYAAAILFGLVHLGNFSPIYPKLLWVYPIFVLPQLLTGFVLGHVRLRYGFFYGFLLHFIINFVFILHYL